MYSRMKSTIAIHPVPSCSRRSPRVAGERARPGKATDRQDTVWQCSMHLNAQCLAALGAATRNIHSASLPKCLRRQSRSPCPMARRSHVGPKLQRISGRRRRRNGPTPMTPLDNAVLGDAANVSKVHLPVFHRLLVPSAGDLVKLEVFPHGLDFRSAKAEPADLFRYFRHGACIL